MMINNIIKNIHLLSVFCVIFGLAVVVNAQTKYPKITHQTLEFNIDAQNLQTLKIIPIYSQKKKKLYELSVTTVSSDQKSAQVVQVLLNVASKSNRDQELKYEPNILNPDRWGHGEGAWIFRPEKICSNNNQRGNFGRKRTFVMRRMKVIIEVANIDCNNDYSGIKSMKIKIKITPSLSNNHRPS